MNARPTSSFSSGAIRWLVVVLLLGLGAPLRAVEIDTGGTITFNTDEPTVSDWSMGWSASGVTGWDYVGQIGGPSGASGVYLGNGWVLTAGHIGPGDLTLPSGTYTFISGSNVNVGNADLTLFQVSNPPPSLPALTISITLPAALSPVVMTGFGGGPGGKTWGYNVVTSTGLNVPVSSYNSTDFETAYDASNGQGITNYAQLVVGDSGGGDFVYNIDHWELTGINEANDANGDSYMVQLDQYESTIDGTTAVPEPRAWAQLVLLGVGGLMAVRKLGRRRSSARPAAR